MNIHKIREEFPQLSERVYGKQLVYLDNAATSLRPQQVIDYWTFLSAHKNANLHRAVHYIAEQATEEFENARDAVCKFINAAHREEIIFTSGTTASINLVAHSFGDAFVDEGDEIIVSEAEHHSNIVPWQMMCERKGAILKRLTINNKGHLNLGELRQMISPKTKIVCINHISNVLGLVNPIKEIVNICHSNNCPVLIDGAQGIVHDCVDVLDLGCDFYVFSGHKIYSAPGVGVLYGRKDLLQAMPPFFGGGEMIQTVSWKGTTYAPLPYKFEAGTQNISGVPTLIPAIDIALSFRLSQFEKSQEDIVSYILEEFSKDSRVMLLGEPGDAYKKIALFSFVVDGVHHEDLAHILDKMGLALRSGQMCAEPLMERFGVTGALRASFAPYNSLDEAKYFISSLHRAIKMLI